MNTIYRITTLRKVETFKTDVVAFIGNVVMSQLG